MGTMYARQYKPFQWYNFAGGWNPRATPMNVKNGEDGQSPMQSPDLLNCDFNYPFGIAKRKGKTKQGNTVTSAQSQSQSVNNNAASQGNSGSGTSNTVAWCEKFTASFTSNISSTIANIAIAYNLAPTNFVCAIRADNSGVPGTLLGTSNVLPTPNSSSTPINYTFTFGTSVSVTSGTVYWLCFQITPSDPIAQTTFKIGTQLPGTNNLFVSIDNYSTFGNAHQDMYYVITYASPGTSINGLFDLRTGTNTITQNIMACTNGSVNYKAGSNWTSIASGLGSGQNNLYDFIETANYLFTTDYANNIPRVWDASATGMMSAGYRMSVGYVTGTTPKSATISSITGAVATMAATQNGSGIFVGKIVTLSGGATTAPEQVVVQSFTYVGSAGSINLNTVTFTTAPQSDRTTMKWNGVTTATDTSGSLNVTVSATPVTTDLNTVKIIGVTALKSGGFRATEEIGVSFAASTATGRILITNVAMNSTTDGTQNGFDIGTAATEWFMTKLFAPGPTSTDPISQPNAQTYYKIPQSMISTSLNPMGNSVTAFNITNVVAGTENTLLQEYGYAQGYFTGQIDAPKLKFLKIFQGFLVGGGDPNNPLRSWITPQYQPNIWSTYSGTAGGPLGGFLDIPSTLNDGQIVQGYYVWQNRLYVFKNQSLYVVFYTGNSTIPFYVQKIQGEIGCLSHWSIRETPFGIVFLSMKGPAVCYGSFMDLLPEAKDIQNMFQPTDANSFNTSAMLYSTSLIYQSKNQIWWGVSSNGSSIRDKVLIYDYEKRIFWQDDGISGNFFQTIGDSNGFPQPWSGDYAAQVYQHDSANDDNGSTINWYYSTPHMNEMEILAKKLGRWLTISGIVQSSGTLYVDEYVDFSATVTTTYSFDMTNAQFKTGLRVPLANNYIYHRLVLRNNDLDVPVQVESMRVDFEPLGIQ